MTKYHVGDEFLLRSAFGFRKVTVEAVYNSPCGTMYEIGGEMVYGDKMHSNYTHIQKIEPRNDAGHGFKLVSEYEVNLPDGAQVVTNKFFVRGNLALDWEHVRAICEFNVRCVTVDRGGVARAFSSYVVNEFGFWSIEDGDTKAIGCVGEDCPDWRDLIFYPPQED